MKMKIIAAAICAALSTTASAQYIGTLPPNVEAGFNYTNDSDKFTTNAWTVGATISNGFGIRYSETSGRGRKSTVATGMYEYDTVTGVLTKYPDAVANTELTISSIRGTYVTVDEDYSIHGSLGVANVHGSMRADNASIAPVESTSTEIVGDVELRLTMTDSLTIGVAAQRSVVESVGNSIAAATGSPIMANSIAVDIDLQVSDNLSVYNQVGVVRYTGNAENTRLLLNHKTTYTILPEYGMSLYMRGKYMNNSDTYNNECVEADTGPTTRGGGCIIAPYFSPKEQVALVPGIQIRQVYGGLVYTGAIEFGRQWVRTDSTVGNNAYGWQLGVQTQPGKRQGTTFGVTAFGSNMSGAADYRWFGLYSWMKVPF